jgi:hypothetical protein
MLEVRCFPPPPAPRPIAVELRQKGSAAWLLPLPSPLLPWGRRGRSRRVLGGNFLNSTAVAPRLWSLITVSLLLLTLGTGCHLVQKAVDMPGQTVRAVTPGNKGKHSADPVEVQQTVLRFADEYLTRMVIGVDNLRHGTNALEPAETLKWRIALGTETCSIASGPNAVADLLDLTVFVTLTRMALEEHWQPRVFGDSAQPMLESCRNVETEIWRYAGTVLKPPQQVELRQSIEAWHRQNPNPENVLAARAMGFASQVAKANQADTKGDSVFSLLQVDPLSGLDPAVREITQTRLFAERALFVAQKMPVLLRWQTELLSVNAVEMPAVQQLVTNSTEIAASVERFARVAEQLPGQLSTEREEILKALQSQETKLTPLVNEVRQTLTAGTQMSTSLNTTLTTFDALMKRFGVGETNQAGPPDTNSQPFRIQDYGQTAVQLEGTARQLTELLRTLDQILDSTNLASLAAKVSPVVQQAQSGGKEIVDYAFWKGILLVAIACGGVLVTILLYRFLRARLTPTTSSKLDPP